MGGGGRGDWRLRDKQDLEGCLPLGPERQAWAQASPGQCSGTGRTGCAQACCVTREQMPNQAPVSECVLGASLRPACLLICSLGHNTADAAQLPKIKSVRPWQCSCLALLPRCCSAPRGPCSAGRGWVTRGSGTEPIVGSQLPAGSRLWGRRARSRLAGLSLGRPWISVRTCPHT